MYDTSRRKDILKMHKPLRTLERIYPRPLVRAVDAGSSLPHHRPDFIRTINLLAAQHDLPAGLDASGRCKDIVITVFFVQFRTFRSHIPVRCAVIDLHRLGDQLLPIRTHFRHIQHALIADAGFGHGIHQIRFAVLIPERTGIDKTGSIIDFHRIAPSAAGRMRHDHIDALVRHRKINIVDTIVKTKRRRPHTTAMHGIAITEFREFLQRITDMFPVHQIPGMQDRQTGHIVKR